MALEKTQIDVLGELGFPADLSAYTEAQLSDAEDAVERELFANIECDALNERGEVCRSILFELASIE
ncbi:hypothetical protein [Olsenella phocaeensis]|uniref:hypothetical protein n=1 Tax=Olsenella phocaeensis TaxID=1852385 RepID=UPI000930872E|nr:hypothetical protein [Olsenella phocaeensis]